MSALNYVVEGYLIAYGPYLWVVKGCEHPKDYLIAYPRYPRNGSLRIKDPSLGVSIAKKLGLVKYFDCLKMEIPLIPRDKVEFVLDPFNKAQWPSLPNNVLLFLRALDMEDSPCVGLAGSYLASKVLPIIPRDLDLIVRGLDCGLKVYNALLRLRRAGLIKPHVENEDFSGTDPQTRNALLGHRVLEGVFSGDLIYSIRVIPCLSNSEPQCIDRVEYYTGKALIERALSPFIMPYTYEAAVDALGTIIVRSQRMRFSEIPEGTRLSLRNCRVEYYEDGKVYLSLDNPECTVSLVR